MVKRFFLILIYFIFFIASVSKAFAVDEVPVQGEVIQVNSNTFQVIHANSNFTCSNVAYIDVYNYNNSYDNGSQYFGYNTTNNLDGTCTQLSYDSFQIRYDHYQIEPAPNLYFINYGSTNGYNIRTLPFGAFGYILPTPTPFNLNVPIIKQISDPWGSQIYDSAVEWTKNSPTISSWGCALTSGVMILKYYGINLHPNGTDLNPGTLNTWLLSQKDGYVGSGFVNWISLSRLSKITKSINGITKFDALEYTRKNSSDINVLKNDINNLTPDIVEEPGHFIVGKGIENTTIGINDPYYNRKTLNEYSNTFLSLGTYIPVNSDLSYIMITMNTDTNIIFNDNLNNNLGESFIQQSLVNDQNINESNYPIKIFYYPKPSNQIYSLLLSSNNNKITNFSIYLYSQIGEAKILKQNIILGPKNMMFTINYDKNNLVNSSISRAININDLINDINQLKSLRLIHSGFAHGLINYAEVIKKDLNNKNKKIALIKLKTLQKIIDVSPKILVKTEAKEILLSDIYYLLRLL